MKTAYYPINPGDRYVYLLESSEFSSPATVYIDILSAREEGELEKAEVRMIFRLQDYDTAEYEVSCGNGWVVSQNGIVTGGRKEFPLPPKKGCAWNESPDICEITSISEKVRVGAGDFEGCMKVETKISGGDGGRSARYYAPGTGLVLEEYYGEDATMRLTLTEKTGIPPIVPEAKKSKRTAAADKTKSIGI